MRTLLILPAIALAGCASPQPPSCEHPDRLWDVTCEDFAPSLPASAATRTPGADTPTRPATKAPTPPKLKEQAPKMQNPAPKPQENKPVKPSENEISEPPTPPEHHAPAENPPHIDGPNVDLPSVPDPDGDVTPGQPPEKPSKPDKAKKDKRDHHHATKRNASEHNRKGGNDGSGGKHRDGSRNSDKGKRK